MICFLDSDIGKRFLAMLGRLDQVLMADPEQAREELRGILGERITLQPDKSGKYLWAEYSLGFAPLLQDAGAGAEIMVAGARFALFLRSQYGRGSIADAPEFTQRTSPRCRNAPPYDSCVARRRTHPAASLQLGTKGQVPGAPPRV